MAARWALRSLRLRDRFPWSHVMLNCCRVNEHRYVGCLVRDNTVFEDVGNAILKRARRPRFGCRARHRDYGGRAWGCMSQK